VQFRRGPDFERHEEYIIRDGDRVRIEFPKDSPFGGQIIVEDGKDRRHYLPDRNEIRVLPPRQDEAYGHLLRMVRGNHGHRLTFAVNGQGRVAGYLTTQIAAVDDSGNIIQRLYIEPKTGAVLKRTLFDPVGTEMGGSWFSSVDLTPKIDPKMFRIVRKGAVVVRPEDTLRQLASTNGFILRTLPMKTGYRLEDVRVFRPMGEVVLMQVFTGSNGRISMFQLGRTIDEERLKEFGRRRFRTYTWTDEGRSFVLVGTQTQDSLERLGRSVTDRP
jgi:outer membrane lipoprotein-sorting protein